MRPTLKNLTELFNTHKDKLSKTISTVDIKILHKAILKDTRELNRFRLASEVEHKPRALAMANNQLDGHGIESILFETKQGKKRITVHYVNLGDTYDRTLLRIYSGTTGKYSYFVSDWGSIAETYNS